VTTFTGDYACKADAKGRIMFPAAFIKQMGDNKQERFVIRKDIFEKCLVMYPWDEWERQVRILRGKINPYNREHNNFLLEFYKGTAELILDATNRLLLPKRLLDWANIEGSDLMLAGQDGRIQIWDKAVYDKKGLSEDEFASLAEKLFGNSGFSEEGQ